MNRTEVESSSNGLSFGVLSPCSEMFAFSYRRLFEDLFEELGWFYSKLTTVSSLIISPLSTSIFTNVFVYDNYWTSSS